MKLLSTILLIGMGISALSAQRFRSILIDDVGNDNSVNTEFIEIKGIPDSSLIDIWYLQIEEEDNTNLGSIRRAFDLSAFQIGPDSIFLLRQSPLLPDPEVCTEVETNNFPDLFNDDATHLLVRNFTGSVNDDLDTDLDGFLDDLTTLPWDTLLSGFSIDECDAAAQYSTQLGISLMPCYEIDCISNSPVEQDSIAMFIYTTDDSSFKAAVIGIASDPAYSYEVFWAWDENRVPIPEDVGKFITPGDCLSILPSSDIGFELEESMGQVVINWNYDLIGSEKAIRIERAPQNGSFTLVKSLSPSDFHAIGSWLDNPGEGLWIYRLLIEFQDDILYSTNQYVKIESETFVQMYYSMENGYFRLNSQLNETGVLSIYDSSGRLRFSVVCSRQERREYDLNHLEKGFYIAQYVSDSSVLSENSSFVR